MAGLRCVTNHYALHAGTRSDFQILANPEYLHGREGFPKSGVHGRFDMIRCPSRPAKSMQRDQMTASMRLGASRLLGPKEFGMSLRDRALARTGTITRSASQPAGGRSPGAPPGASWRAAARAMEVERPMVVEQLSPMYTGVRGDGTVGRFRYVPPPECAEIMQSWSSARAVSGVDYPR
uniref:Uncharacterized protein n=1 Tax=Alexandrium monilatum TaxID=311494 RepID=A0A7S4SRY4_9DINO